MKTLYLWVSDKGWTPFQYNELSELAAEFEALAEVIAMAEGGVESADEDFAKYMRKHLRNANKLMVKFNKRKKI